MGADSVGKRSGSGRARQFVRHLPGRRKRCLVGVGYGQRATSATPGSRPAMPAPAALPAHHSCPVPRTGGMGALVRLHPDDDHDVSAFHPAARGKPWTISRLPAQVVISPLLSQTTAAAPAGSTNPGRVSPKAAADSRARPASATTETLGQMAPRSSQVSSKSAVPCLPL